MVPLNEIFRAESKNIHQSTGFPNPTQFLKLPKGIQTGFAIFSAMNLTSWLKQLSKNWGTIGFLLKGARSSKSGTIGDMHLHRMVEPRELTIFTEHKLLIFTFHKKISPRQFRYLDYFGQFTTDIQHVPSCDNIFTSKGLLSTPNSCFLKSNP